MSSTSSNLSAFLNATLNSLSVLTPSDPATLLHTSDVLLKSFRDALQTSTQTMLPSFTYLLPEGEEAGTTVAMDLGGSTLRIAVIRIYTRARRSVDVSTHVENAVHKAFSDVKSRKSWVVDDSVKRLPSAQFFDWIVKRMAGVLKSAGEGNGRGLSLGVTWSFPVMQTSLNSGWVQEMGKGYETWNEIAGTDLKGHFEAAFARQGVSLKMTALLNDTEATLLSHAHTNPSTRLSLIWGTGMNAAIQLPVSAIAQSKFGERPEEWKKTAKSVLVNTEISLFGGHGVLPLTKADEELDSLQSHPGFQPYEQMASGRYLGEITRLLLVQAVQSGQLFRGSMPHGLETRWSLTTATTNTIEK